MEKKIVDHLFRHQYGKMVAVLTHIFGLSNIETIEDAVQDTFIKATLQWRYELPDNPAAWLIKASKNRMVDLLRQINAEKNRYGKLTAGTDVIQLHDMFLDHEIEDSQLRMIFVACHPGLHANEQIAFALKTISGFSTSEIAAALLLKEETIKKRLSRARKSIAQNNIQFEFPPAGEVEMRLGRVMEVIYLTFNEGFHSTNQKKLIREDLCGEAIRLCKLLLKKEIFRSGSLYALFALMCFHASRLESKTNEKNEIIDLKNQDRRKWYRPLMSVGNQAMIKSMEYEDISVFHFEATIAAEHLKAGSFDDTNWSMICDCYEKLYRIQPSALTQLNMAVVYLQLEETEKARQLLDSINVKDLEQRTYLYYGCYADYFEKSGDLIRATTYLDKSILEVNNDLEKRYLTKKKNDLLPDHLNLQ